jgi:hypothetical protein
MRVRPKTQREGKSRWRPKKRGRAKANRKDPLSIVHLGLGLQASMESAAGFAVKSRQTRARKFLFFSVFTEHFAPNDIAATRTIFVFSRASSRTDMMTRCRDAGGGGEWSFWAFCC